MNSSLGRNSARFFQRLDFKKFKLNNDEKMQIPLEESFDHQSERLPLKLHVNTLETLFKNKDYLDDQSFETNINWLHLIGTPENRIAFTMDELCEQFSVLENVLGSPSVEEKGDEFKIAIERYKLAIMQAALLSLKNNEEENADLPPSKTIHGLYYFLLIGGSWIAYLHGYDAAEAIVALFPFAVPVSVVWATGSLLFLVALGIFSAFEAAELSKHLGFQSVKNLQTTFDINQKQIEITHGFAKQLALHSEQNKIGEAKQYEKYALLAKKFDLSIKKTKERVDSVPETKIRKVTKLSLLFFGMAFTAADEIFLVLGFGALALSGPWGWVIIAATALIGAVLFYVAFNNMIRDKVSPALKQKEEIQHKYAEYKKDDLLQSVEERLMIKKKLDQLENELLQKKCEIYQLNLDQRRREVELNEMREASRTRPITMGVISGQDRVPQKNDKERDHLKVPQAGLLSMLNFSKLRAIPPPIKKSPDEPTAIVLSDYFGQNGM